MNGNNPKIDTAIARHAHRVGGLLNILAEHIADTENAGDLTWGHVGDLIRLESQLVEALIAAQPGDRDFNEDEARETLLAAVDPEGVADVPRY